MIPKILIPWFLYFGCRKTEDFDNVSDNFYSEEDFTDHEISDG
jgi:hypothetical protein